MHYPLAEQIATDAPLADVVMRDPVPEELYEVVTFIPNVQAIRLLLQEGYNGRVTNETLAAAVCIVEERLEQLETV